MARSETEEGKVCKVKRLRLKRQMKSNRREKGIEKRSKEWKRVGIKKLRDWWWGMGRVDEFEKRMEISTSASL